LSAKNKKIILKKDNLIKKLAFWAIAIFILKIFIIYNIGEINFNLGNGQFIKINGIWLGADGENYLKGYQALLQDGVFAKEAILNYWPAGYPLFLLLLSLLGKSWVLTTLSIVQSIAFTYASYFFTKQLLATKLRNIASPVLILLILNPTLSLSSLVIGYESLVASGILICAGLIVKDFIEKNNSKIKFYLLHYSLISGFIMFIQPRFIVSLILVMVFWVIIRIGLKFGVVTIVLSLALILLMPATLIYRNNQATGINSISTNLGTTMNIGAGADATGGYDDKNIGVECNVSGSAAQQDAQKVKCVLAWYLENPITSLKLFYNKSVYFWSPWSGLLAEGTMARNPWLKINPLANIASTPAGSNLVYGNFGRIISWLWILAGMYLLFAGFYKLWKIGGVERILSVVVGITIGSNWLITLITIGDHRFRVPIMGLSLFIQGVGFVATLNRKALQIAQVGPLR
jgi:hypothetical protein